jgi:plastocyanin
MTRYTPGFLVVALAALVFLLPADAMTAPKLSGTVGSGFTITLKQGTTKLKTLKAGTYTINVRDKASIHNFHLFGPGVNKKTAVSAVGTQTWTVKLKPGKYTYQCDPHALSGMKATFRVTR